MYQRKYYRHVNTTLSRKAPPKPRICELSTYLAGAHFIERDKSKCLGHHSTGKILLRQSQRNCDHRQKQLWNEG